MEESACVRWRERQRVADASVRNDERMKEEGCDGCAEVEEHAPYVVLRAVGGQKVSGGATQELESIAHHPMPIVSPKGSERQQESSRPRAC